MTTSVFLRDKSCFVGRRSESQMVEQTAFKSFNYRSIYCKKDIAELMLHT